MRVLDIINRWSNNIINCRLRTPAVGRLAVISDTPKTLPGGILHFLGLQRSTIAVLGMVVLVGMGERMSERFLPVYMMALGGGAISIGLLNGLDNLLSALYSFPGGICRTGSAPSVRCWCSTWSPSPGFSSSSWSRPGRP